MTAPIGLRYPKRAERLGRREYDDYRVFPEFWTELLVRMAEGVRKLVANDAVNILGIYGPQGTGKTLFARQVQLDFVDLRGTREDPGPDERQRNTWFSIAGGRDKDWERTTLITGQVQLKDLTGDANWVNALAGYSETGVGSIVFYDNAERISFFKGLEYRGSAATRDSFIDEAAQNLVEASRTRFSRTLLVLLSNDLAYLESLQKAIDLQERGLMSIAQLALPSPEDKERAVRTNINRLNPLSYWACLDRSPRDDRNLVKDRLVEQATFPDAFEAVDQAFEASTTTRQGRPGKRNQLVLVTMVDDEEVAGYRGTFGPGATQEVDQAWIFAEYHSSGWARSVKDDRRAALLESEWGFRSVVLGRPFIATLLSGSPDRLQLCKDLLALLTAPGGHTFGEPSRRQLLQKIQRLMTRWPAIEDDQDAELRRFWSSGAPRSGRYEKVLGELIPNYNTVTAVEGRARPDWTQTSYTACSVLKDLEGPSMKREANFIEFHSTQRATATQLKNYLGTKLPNYAALLENL